MFPRHAQRILAVVRAQNVVALRFQHVRNQMTHGRLIFHDQQCFGSARKRPGFDNLRRGVQRLIHSRKINLEGRAPANLAVNADVAAGLLDDGLAGRQSQTGAFATGLRGEKCFKQTRFDLPGHAGSRVTDAEHHVLAGRCVRMGALALWSGTACPVS